MRREEIFIDLGGGAPKTPIFYAKMSEIRISTVFDGHAGWLATPRPLAKNRGMGWGRRGGGRRRRWRGGGRRV